MSIAISGADIAGPTLGFWLRKCGHDVLLIEEATTDAWPRRCDAVAQLIRAAANPAER